MLHNGASVTSGHFAGSLLHALGKPKFNCSCDAHFAFNGHTDTLTSIFKVVTLTFFSVCSFSGILAVSSLIDLYVIFCITRDFSKHICYVRLPAKILNLT